MGGSRVSLEIGEDQPAWRYHHPRTSATVGQDTELVYGKDDILNPFFVQVTFLNSRDPSLYRRYRYGPPTGAISFSDARQFLGCLCRVCPACREFLINRYRDARSNATISNTEIPRPVPRDTRTKYSAARDRPARECNHGHAVGAPNTGVEFSGSDLGIYGTGCFGRGSRRSAHSRAHRIYRNTASQLSCAVGQYLFDI